MTARRGPGRPTDGYYLEDGTRVPSSTTVTGRAKDAGGMIYKAKKNWHEAGRLGKPFRRDDYWGEPETWGLDVLTAGSVVHQWIEDTLFGMPLTQYPDLDAQVAWHATIGFEAFGVWHSQVRPVVVETEVPLVSERFRFGGTLDSVALVADVAALFDWKTSNGTYPDYVAQVASYRQLLRERDGDAAPKSAYLLRVGKQHGDFHLHYWPTNVLDLGWKWFASALDLYNADATLKKVSR